MIKARVSVRWNRAGDTLAVAVSGGSARFRRCAAGALRGQVAGVARRGLATARFVLDRSRLGPVTVPAPPPPPVGGGLDTCTVDRDCTVYFRSHACVAGDPIAVAASKLELARTTYPVKRDACAMGGPQYERLRMQHEGRWSATCVAGRCTLHDAGLRRSPLDDLRAP